MPISLVYCIHVQYPGHIKHTQYFLDVKTCALIYMGKIKINVWVLFICTLLRGVLYSIGFENEIWQRWSLTYRFLMVFSSIDTTHLSPADNYPYPNSNKPTIIPIQIAIYLYIHGHTQHLTDPIVSDPEVLSGDVWQFPSTRNDAKTVFKTRLLPKTLYF